MPTCSGLYRSDACFEDADPNLDGLKLIKNTKGPVLIRQLKEVHGMKKRIDEIMKNAELRGEVYLDAEDKRWVGSRIWRWCSCPRTNTIKASPIYAEFHFQPTSRGRHTRAREPHIATCRRLGDNNQQKVSRTFASSLHCERDSDGIF